VIDLQRSNFSGTLDKLKNLVQKLLVQNVQGVIEHVRHRPQGRLGDPTKITDYSQRIREIDNEMKATPKLGVRV
jgi:hypothetical protein